MSTECFGKSNENGVDMMFWRARERDFFFACIDLQVYSTHAQPPCRDSTLESFHWLVSSTTFFFDACNYIRYLQHSIAFPRALRLSNFVSITRVRSIDGSYSTTVLLYSITAVPVEASLLMSHF